MENMNKIRSFNDFWPRWLRAHSSRATVVSHVVGLALSLALAGAMLASGMIFFLVLAVVPALGGAAVGHRLSPRKDRVSPDHPEWAARADLRLFGLAVTGKLGAEIERLPELPSLPSHPALAA